MSFTKCLFLHKIVKLNNLHCLSVPLKKAHQASLRDPMMFQLGGSLDAEDARSVSHDRKPKGHQVVGQSDWL